MMIASQVFSNNRRRMGAPALLLLLLTICLAMFLSAPLSLVAAQTSTTTSTEQATTVEPTSVTLITAAHTFPPLPSTLTEFTASALPPSPDPFQQLNDKTSMDAVKNVVRSFSGGTMPYSVTLQASMPVLGSMVAIEAGVPEDVTYVVSVPDADAITFSSANVSALVVAMDAGYTFSMNPAENLDTQRSGLAKVEGRDGSGAHQGVAVLSGLRELRVNPGPATPYSSPQLQFEQNVTRGGKFSLDLGFFFTHAMPLPMQFSFADQAGQELPSTLQIQCRSDGNCIARGTFGMFQEDPLRLLFQATDGYKVTSGFAIIWPIAVPIHIVHNIPNIHLRPGKRFSVSLPGDLFESSTTINYDKITQPGGIPLPSGIFFEAPRSLKGSGSYKQVGPLPLQLFASDVFFAAEPLNFTVTFTNQPIVCNLSAALGQQNQRQSDQSNGAPSSSSVAPASSPSSTTTTSSTTLAALTPMERLIRPTAALIEFTRTVDMSKICTDADGDKLEYSVVPDQAWLRTSVSRSAGHLTLSGVAPARTAQKGDLVNISVTVREWWMDPRLDADLFVHFFLELRVHRNTAPRLRRPVPNITMVAGEVRRVHVVVPDYFDDDQSEMGDFLKVRFNVEKNDVVGWLKLDVVSVRPKASYTLLATPPATVPDGTRIELDFWVEDHLGLRTQNYTTTVSVEWTLWMKSTQAIVIILSIGSSIMTVLGFWWVAPSLYNSLYARRSSKVVIPCPLNRRNNWMHRIPRETITFQYLVKDPNGVVNCMTKLFPQFYADQMKLVSTFDGESVYWLTIKEYTVTFNPPEDPDAPLPGTHMPLITFRCFNRHNFLLQQFEVDYHQLCKEWQENEARKNRGKKKYGDNEDDFFDLDMMMDDGGDGELDEEEDEVEFREKLRSPAEQDVRAQEVLQRRHQELELRHEEQLTVVKMQRERMSALKGQIHEMIGGHSSPATAAAFKRQTAELRKKQRAEVEGVEEAFLARAAAAASKKRVRKVASTANSDPSSVGAAPAAKSSSEFSLEEFLSTNFEPSNSITNNNSSSSGDGAAAAAIPSAEPAGGIVINLDDDADIDVEMKQFASENL